MQYVKLQDSPTNSSRPLEGAGSSSTSLSAEVNQVAVATNSASKLKAFASHPVTLYGIKFATMGLWPGIAFAVMNWANKTQIASGAAVYFAIISGIVNTIGYTNYAGDLFVKLLINVFYQSPKDIIQQYQQQGWQSAGKLLAHKLALATAFTAIAVLGVGAAAPCYSGLFAALLQLGVDYSKFWLAVNIMQYAANILMMTTDAYHWLAKQFNYYLLQDAEGKKRMVSAEVLQSKLNEVLFIDSKQDFKQYATALSKLDTSSAAAYWSSLHGLTTTHPLFKPSQAAVLYQWIVRVVALGTAWAMLWAYNGNIIDIINHPELSLGGYEKILKNWVAAMLFNAVTNGIFSYVNSQDGFHLMTVQLLSKAHHNVQESSDKLKAGIANGVGILLLWGLVVSSVFGAVFLTFASADAANSANAAETNWYLQTLTPKFVKALAVLAAIEGFGINAKPIVERVQDVWHWLQVRSESKMAKTAAIEPSKETTCLVDSREIKAQNRLSLLWQQKLCQAAAESDTAYQQCLQAKTVATALTEKRDQSPEVLV